jgi:hypothetical protein
MAIGFCSLFFGSFFLQILRLEKKPWRKTGPGAQAETKQQGWKKAMAKEAWKKAMAKEVWKKAMTKEAWKKANKSEVELTGSPAWT